MDALDIVKKIQNISENDALQDYLKLCKTTETRDSVRIGNKCMNYFFKVEMLKTKSSRLNKSFLEMLESNDFQKPYYQKVIKYNIAKNHNEIMATYQAFQIYCGTICGFKPIIARNLFKALGVKKVVDPCAGFGGRCLGAMSLGIDYVGIDTNTNLKQYYDAMLELCHSESKVELYYEDSAKFDYSKLDYDCVFTSPPYYKREIYNGMPEYISENDFTEKFLKPLLKNSFQNLKTGGHYALNIPISMFETVKSILGEPNSEIPLFMKKRTGAKNGEQYKEYIYVWNKN